MKEIPDIFSPRRKFITKWIMIQDQLSQVPLLDLVKLINTAQPITTEVDSSYVFGSIDQFLDTSHW